jgi:hypothetical protein
MSIVHHALWGVMSAYVMMVFFMLSPEVDMDWDGASQSYRLQDHITLQKGLVG